ncbi:MAG: UDP-3-O-[3-hydroxymyristoyl] N-acetylglucosamine deacetylase [Abitibacteriaceae bacterium]|nr:UDP-3-O-[3-hydroxymyristoyl] N-acetylglucosamine deacetylase [Abditibacteriaceae bacterium]MBV9868112.1 UDP-3-O-[3-hydroxymyristoyl] N-acetylglucosamine deacetylase [Abditibacteriaceae bacterium]
MSFSPSFSFQTLRRDVQISGIGLHTGATITARLRPRAACGLVFVRMDLPESPQIAVTSRSVVSTTHATTLEQQGAQVSTTEHLLAALWAMNITHCCIELNGPEVPILDGSAQGWCRLIEDAGVVAIGGSAPTDLPAVTSNCHEELPQDRQRPLYRLQEPVWVTDGDGSVLGVPCNQFRLTVVVDYNLDYVGQQAIDLNVTPSSFQKELAPARTFTLEQWIAPLQAQGLIKGGSTDNAIVLGQDAPSSPWRFANELARHKALDVVGDVALLFGEDGGALQAHLIAIRAGHSLHRRWMEECLRQSALVKTVA